MHFCTFPKAVQGAGLECLPGRFRLSGHMFDTKINVIFLKDETIPPSNQQPVNFSVTPRHPPLHQLSHDEALLLENINHSTQQHSKIPETSQVIPSWSLSLHSYAYLSFPTTPKLPTRLLKETRGKSLL